MVLLGSFFVLGEGWFPRRRTGLSLSLSLSWPLCSGAAGVAAGEGSGAVAAGVSAGGETGGVGFGGSDPAPDPGRRNTGGLSWSSSRGADGSERVASVKSAAHRKQSLRNACPYRFIDRIPLERHGNWRSLIRSGVIEFAIEHHGDWDQASFAIGRKLKQSQRPWSFSGRFTTSRLRRNGLAKYQGQAGQHDDGGHRQV